MNLVSQIVGSIDSAVLNTSSQFFQNTASSVLSLYTALLGLLFAFLGVMVALNVYAIAMRDAVQIGMRIVLVFAFGLSWANFSVLYDALTNTSQNLAMAYFSIGGSGLGSQPDVAMDAFATDMATTVDTVAQPIARTLHDRRQRLEGVGFQVAKFDRPMFAQGHAQSHDYRLARIDGHVAPGFAIVALGCLDLLRVGLPLGCTVARQTAL